VAKVLADDESRAKLDAILSGAADRAACTVLEHRSALLAVADELCRHDELDGAAVLRLVGSGVRPSSTG
jgi:hypothetical protein